MSTTRPSEIISGFGVDLEPAATAANQPSASHPDLHDTMCGYSLTSALTLHHIPAPMRGGRSRLWQCMLSDSRCLVIIHNDR